MAILQGFLDTPEDMDWLTVHCPWARLYGSAMVYGNMDAPQKVDFWYTVSPNHDQAPDDSVILWE